METRKEPRFQILSKARWTHYSESRGFNSGIVGNISRSGCLLKTCEPIEYRRWIRILLTTEQTNLSKILIGKVIRCEKVLESTTEGEFTLYRYGITFTFPAFQSLQVEDLILAFSTRNFKVLSCRSANKKSSFRPGFLA